MKFSKIFNPTFNRKTNQVSFSLRAKELKRMGLTPSKILEMTIPRNEYSFYKHSKKAKRK